MQFGLLLVWNTPVDGTMGSDSCGFDKVVEQVVLAERLGFTSVWPLRRDPVLGDVPQPWPHGLMTKIAESTRTIRIGHRLWAIDGSGNVPLRVAEHAAALDLLCAGRLEIDCSPGPAITDDGAACEYRWNTTDYAVEAVRNAWSRSELALHWGAFFDLPDSAAVAKPLQCPHPPLWMSVNVTAEWEMAGRLGVGVVVSTPPGTGLQSRIDAYRHAVGRSGNRSGPRDQTAVSAMAICSATGRIGVGASQTASWPRRRGELGNGSTAMVPAETGLLIGDAESCAEAVRAYARVGVNQLVCHFPVPGGPHAETATAMMRFGRDVISASA